MIGPGDSVICIKRPKEHPLAPWVFPPVVGSEWIVLDVGPSVFRPGLGAIRLLGDGLPPVSPCGGRCPAWPLEHFRKIAALVDETAIEIQSLVSC